MFFARSDPEDLDPGRLAALRLSLNAPVVSVPELPAGPARAAIALWWESEGQPVLEVRLRSVATGQRVVYGFEERLEGAGDVDHALEAGLNFAESMGFLFDEDAISADDTADRIRVREAWAAFATTGEGAGDAPEKPPEEPPGKAFEEAPGEAETALLELTEVAEPDEVADPSKLTEVAEPDEVTELTEVAEPDEVAEPTELTELAEPDEVTEATELSEPDPEPDPAPAGAAARAATEPAPLGESGPEPPVLTKFRPRPEPDERPAAARSEPPAAARSERPVGRMRAALGRVPLVRRRKRRGGERPSLLTRVLGAF